MLSAIEAAAKERTALIDRAPGRAEVYACSVLISRKTEDLFASGLVDDDLISIGLDIIALLRVENQNLTAPAAFRTAVAGDLGLSVRGQFSLSRRRRAMCFRRPVLRAARANDLEMVKLLVSRGGDVKSP